MNSSHPNDGDEKPPPPSVPPPSYNQNPSAPPRVDPPPTQGQPVSGAPPDDQTTKGPQSSNPPSSGKSEGGGSETVPPPSDPTASYGKNEMVPPPPYPYINGSQPPYDQYTKGAPPSDVPPPYGQTGAAPFPTSPYSGQYVVGVPPQHTMIGPPTWSTGLFECFDDIPTFCITFFCPCVTFGQIAEIVDKGATNCGVYAAVYSVVLYFTGCACLISSYYRMKMSRQYNLPDNALMDLLIHFLCEPCALCQEHRELQARGFDMTLGVGWNENMERQQNQGIMMAPTPPGGMTR